MGMAGAAFATGMSQGWAENRKAKHDEQVGREAGMAEQLGKIAFDPSTPPEVKVKAQQALWQIYDPNRKVGKPLKIDLGQIYQSSGQGGGQAAPQTGGAGAPPQATPQLGGAGAPPMQTPPQAQPAAPPIGGTDPAYQMPSVGRDPSRQRTQEEINYNINVLHLPPEMAAHPERYGITDDFRGAPRFGPINGAQAPRPTSETVPAAPQSQSVPSAAPQVPPPPGTSAHQELPTSGMPYTPWQIAEQIAYHQKKGSSDAETASRTTLADQLGLTGKGRSIFVGTGKMPQIDPIKLANSGLKYNEAGDVVPMAREEMSEPVRSKLELNDSIESLRTAQEELARARAAGLKPGSPQYDLALRRFDLEQQRTGMMLARLGLSQKQFELSTYGTVGGQAPPGGLTDANGNPVGWKAPMAPTSATKTKAQQAAAVLSVGNDLIAKIRENADALGPMSGRYTNFEQYLGSIPASSAELAALQSSFSALLPGLHQFRSQKVVQEFEKKLGTGDFKTNAEAMEAGVRAMMQSAQTMQKAWVTVPAPPGSTAKTQHKVGDIILGPDNKRYKITAIDQKNGKVTATPE